MLWHSINLACCTLFKFWWCWWLEVLGLAIFKSQWISECKFFLPVWIVICRLLVCLVRFKIPFFVLVVLPQESGTVASPGKDHSYCTVAYMNLEFEHCSAPIKLFSFPDKKLWIKGYVMLPQQKRGHSWLAIQEAKSIKKKKGLRKW